MREDGRDEWATPQKVFDQICNFWDLHPTIDVCCDATNIKCPWGYTWEANSLKLDWNKEHAVGWMNPPYSQPEMTEFIEKAIAESLKGFTTVFLLPNWTDQAWYHDLIKPYQHEFWRGRIKHDPPPGVKPSSPRHGSIHGVISKQTKILTFEDLI